MGSPSTARRAERLAGVAVVAAILALKLTFVALVLDWV